MSSLGSLRTGFESVPRVRRPQWGKIAVQALVVLVVVLALWSVTARGMVQYGPDRPGDADGFARVTSCERVGPISRGGIGVYWFCTADVTTEEGETRSARFRLNELTPADIGKPVPVEGSRTPRRAADKPVVWWSVAPGIAFVLGLAAWAELHRRKRLRHRTERWQANVRLTAASCVLAAGAGPGTGRGSRKISPAEWSGPRYWRLAGSIMVPGAVFATVGAFAGSADAREILTVLGLMCLAAPIWLMAFTPRWYRTSEYATAVTISADGFGWYRRGQTTFMLDWAEVAEVRLTTIDRDGLVLRMIDFFLTDAAVGRRGELRGLWQLGAELGTHRLPGEKGAYRLPEAFSDAAASQVREAMAVYQPDRFRVFTAEIDETMVTA
jgi:hypothetical protein